MSANIKRVRPDQGDSISVVGDTYRIIIDGKDTQGAYAMIDMKIPPGAGPPPHAHPNFSETFYVIGGQVEFVTENGNQTARKGDLVNIPKGGAVHGFQNVSDQVAHLLCTVVPAGLEAFFREIGTPVEPGEFLPPLQLDEKGAEKLRVIAEKYGQVIYPPDYLDK